MSLPLVSDLPEHASILWILGIFVSLFLLSYTKFLVTNLQFIRNNFQIKTLRRFLLFLILLIFSTLLYWEIDVHFIELPHPGIPYIFFILIATIFFGVRIGLITFGLTIFLIDYYLFEPRFTFYLFHHGVDMAMIIAGLIVSLFIGQRIRFYEETFRKRNIELGFLIKARERLIAIAAHELKTPLTSINLYAQILSKQYQQQEIGSTLQRSVKTIERETVSLTEMINDLLDFSRVQNNKSSLKPEHFDLGELITRKIEIVQSLFPDHRYIFQQQLTSAKIYADRISIERIITNLLTNAGKYSAPDTKVIIRLQKDKNYYVIKVEDHGSGIGQDQQARLFEPFYQVENGKQGLGLGLYITKTLVKLHNGKIWIESKIGKGSTFFIALPKSVRKT